MSEPALTGPPGEDSGAEARPTAAPTTEDGPDWQRLHPISPFLRGGVMILAVGGYFISQRMEDLLGYSWGPGTPDDVGFDEGLPFGSIWLAVLAFLALVLVVVLYGWLAWRVAKFRIGETTLEYRWGLLFTQHRQVRYDRIQSVDISRPLLARLFGLSQVVVQSAGGSDSHVQLAFLTHGRALQVRDAVLSLVDLEDGPAPDEPQGHVPPTEEGDVLPAGGAYAYPGIEALVRGDVAPTRGRQVLRTVAVPMSRLVASLVYHPVTVIVALVIPVTIVTAMFTSVAVLPILVPVFFGAVLPHARRFLTEANFSVAIERDRVRITHGLTDQRSNTVPLARIQALEISQSLFWRWPDWWRMRVTIAGVVGENTESQTTAFPVGTADEVLDLAGVMLPGIDRAALVAGMRGSGGEPGFTTSSRRSAVFQPWTWRRNGYAVAETSLVVRRGRLTRVVSLVPHARVQSLRIEQGPLDRWRRVASVHADLTAGPVSGAVPHLDVPEAHRLLAEQSRRSTLARTVPSGRLRWDTRSAGAGEQTTARTEGSTQL